VGDILARNYEKYMCSLSNLLNSYIHLGGVLENSSPDNKEQQRWYHRHMTTAAAQAHPNIAFIKYRLAKLD
jgi:hypothetical protein